MIERRALAAAFIAFCAAASAGQLQLRYVAILTRHGVRSPTWSKERLSQYAAEPWPDWGVAPGYLTPHGSALMKLMGAYYREWLTGEGLLARTGCDGAHRVYIWADTDQRTIETGRALSDALAPGCSIAVHSLPQGERDPLFHRAVADKAPREQLNVAPPQAAFASLQRVLNGKSASPAEASTLAEDLLLEYTNGWSGAQLGWGRLSVDGLSQILELHAAHSDMMRRTPSLARPTGSNLLAHILASIEQAATGKPAAGALGEPGDTVLIVSGHDTNVANLSGMLGLSWKLPGYPANETPPGGALIFELWRDESGADVVTARYVAQTLGQMNDGTPLSLASPPAIANLPVPGCAQEKKSGGCPWPVFERTAQAAIDPQFVTTDDLRK